MASRSSTVNGQRNITDTVTAISITLGSTSPHEIPRRLKLGDEPITIGRASRNELRGAAAKPDNALFECPVVSREHAELATQKDDFGEDEVILTDLKSMHGTFVNGQGLEPGIPFLLQDGDMIQLGTSVARGSGRWKLINLVCAPTDKQKDTFKGVTVVFKKHDIDSRDEGLSTRSTYSVPAESDVASEISDDFDEDLDEVDHDDDTYSTVDPDYYKYDGLSDEIDDLDEAAPEEIEVKKIGTQEKPIEVDDWPAGSLRHVLDLTQSGAPPTKLPAMQPVKTDSLTQKSTYSAQMIPPPMPSTAPVAKALDLSKSSCTQEPEKLARQPSVELSTVRQPAVEPVCNEPSQFTQKPRYDPVRGTPPLSSSTIVKPEIYKPVVEPQSFAPEWPTWDGPPRYLSSFPPPPAFPPPAIHIPMPPAMPVPAPPVAPDLLVGLNLDDLLRAPAPKGPFKGKSKNKSKKRKAEVCVDSDEDFIAACDSLAQLSHQCPAKKAKLEQPSRVQSIISDVRKYAFGAALGATGTFTFLASPLGGALADWMSKY